MSLTRHEENSILSKTKEYKCLLKKSVFNSFVLMNMSASKIQVCVTLYYHLLNFISEHRESFGQHWSRISDYDHMSFDALQVFVVKQIVNIVMKYKSYDEE